jgi:hypothetical protein
MDERIAKEVQVVIPQGHVKTATRAIYEAIDRLGQVEAPPLTQKS